MTAKDPAHSPQAPEPGGTAQTLRPQSVPPVALDEVLDFLARDGHPGTLEGPGAQAVAVSGIGMDSREVQPGDLYVALPGANAHGAQFLGAARAAGALAVLTDAAGLALVRQQDPRLPVIVVETVREAVGPLGARIYRSQPTDPSVQRLFAVTGTNGKTTTTYMIDSLMEALGHTTGLIGTIEIRAGEDTIPSTLTTPESTHVHALITVMRERGVTAAAMEVSSHALDYRRVDGLVYDVAGFTNLTQDHLDLHGTMDEYCRSKAQLFTRGHARRAVVSVDDDWGLKMAESARAALGEDAVLTLSTGRGRGAQASGPAADWILEEVLPEGIGHGFALRGPDGALLRAHTGLPADFNVSNAALAVAMVAESGVDRDALAQALRTPEALTPLVPGRMQVVGEAPVAIVDFAHNPDALQRALEAMDPGHGGRVIVVFGATGERDQLKRPIMGSIAARHADVVIITDDDPHREPPAPIRQAVAAGAREAVAAGARATVVEELAPRAEAIRRAVALAGPQDAILVAGRGHEVSQDVGGVDLELDDREELRAALRGAADTNPPGGHGAPREQKGGEQA